MRGRLDDEAGCERGIPTRAAHCSRHGQRRGLGFLCACWYLGALRTTVARACLEASTHAIGDELIKGKVVWYVSGAGVSRGGFLGSIRYSDEYNLPLVAVELRG